MARKQSPLLDALFLPHMQGVLSATVLRPEREWYLSGLASHLRVRPSSLQRTLGKLLSAGILIRRGDSNRVYYRTNPACPILGELAGILAKTAGIADRVRDVLEPLSGRIRVAFIHGSVAEGRERSESDVDLILIGDAPGMELATAIRPLSDALGREVNFSRYTAAEFKAKVDSAHYFLSKVLERPKIFVTGNEHDLEDVIGGEARRGRAARQARA